MDIAGIAEGAAGGIIGTGMGLLLEGHNDRRQLAQEAKLQAQQMAGQKEMAEFNRMQQMKMWEDTNYSAQIKQLKKAGLNPGLIYGMSGGGGATTNAAQAAGPTSGSAPKGGGEAMGLMAGTMQAGIQTALIQAQKDLLEAQAKTEEVKPENITAATQNTKADTALKQIQARIQTIDAEIAGRTLEDKIDIITAEASSATTDALRVQRQNNIEAATMQTVMDKIKADYIAVLLQNANTAQDTKLKTAQTTTEKGKPPLQRQELQTQASGIVQKWRSLELEGRRITTDEIKAMAGENIGQDLLDALQSILLLREAGKRK